MSVLAIDVGLKNLSFCIMTYADKKDLKTYKFLLWDVYNTMEDGTKFCKNIQKNKKICDKKCSFRYEDNFYCKKHIPKDIKVREYKETSMKELSLQNIALLIINKVVEVYNKNIQIFKNLTEILIELQPKINPKMTFISHILFGKIIELLPNVKLNFVRASSKLKAYNGPEIECKLKGDYAKRKYLSIQYVKWFFENEFSTEEKEKWFGKLNEKDKLDDLCDTVLYCINSIYGIPKKIKNKK